MIHTDDRTLVFSKDKLEEYKQQIEATKEPIVFWEQRLMMGHYGVLGWILSSKPKKKNCIVKIVQTKDWNTFKSRINALKEY